MPILDENRVIELKYSAKTFGKMTEDERSLAAYQILLKIHAVRGWSIPVSELMDILVGEFEKKLSEKELAYMKAAYKKLADIKASEKKASGKTTLNTITVEMTKDSGSNTNCADNCYAPNKVQIKVGETVTWKNVDTATHTVTSGKDATSDGIFDSGMINVGNSFNHKFDKAGTSDYFCMVHPWMKGKVTVS